MKLPVRAWVDTLAALGIRRRKQLPKAKRPSARQRHFESLEPRQMLTTTLYWDGGSSGTWDTTTANWSASSGGGSDVVWDSSATAVFSGTNATVSVATGVSAAGIQFTGGGNNLTGNSIELTGSATIDVAPGLSDTIASSLTGSAGFTKTGTGLVLLASADTYSGPTAINAGTLKLGDVHSIYYSSTLSSAAGATLDLNGMSITSAVPPFDNFAGTIANSNATTTANFNGPINAGAQSSFTIDGSGTTTLGGVITGDSSTTITHNGSGTVVIDGTLVGDGISVVNNSGTMQFTHGVTLGSLLIGDGGIVVIGGVPEYDGPPILYWDPTQSGGAALGGDGTWNLTDHQWFDGASDVAWTDGALAEFSGDVGTVTVPTGINASQIDFLSGGYQLEGGSLSIASGCISVPLSDTVTIDTALVGANTLDKVGLGTLIVGGDNSYSNFTTISSGVLRLASATALGHSSFVMGRPNSALDLNGQSIGDATPLNNFLGSLVNSNTSTPAVFAGAVNTGAYFSMPLTVGGSGTITLTGDIEGNQKLTKTGAGMLILAPTDIHIGQTTVSAGTLQIGDGAIDVDLPGNIVNNATVIFAPHSAETYSKVLSGTGTVSVNGSGSLTLSGQSTFNGGLTLNSGTLIVAADSTLTSGALTGGPLGVGTFTLNGGTVEDDGQARAVLNSVAIGSAATVALTSSSDNNLSFDSWGLTAAPTFGVSGGAIVTTSHTVTILDAITGSGGLTASGTGTLIVAATNSYTGGTTVSSGATLKLGDGFGDDGSVSGNIANSGSLLFANDSPLTYAGVISGSGTVTVAGIGDLTLSGANSYSGATSVTGYGFLLVTGAATVAGATDISTGSVSLGNAGSLGNSAISVSANAALQGSVGATGAGTAGATVSLASNSTFDMTDGAVGTFNLNSQTSFSGPSLTVSGATFDFDVSSSGADQLAVAGAASVSGTNTINITGLGTSLTVSGTYDLIIAASGLTGTFYFSNGSTTETVLVGDNVYTLQLSNSGTAETLTVAAPPAYAVFYGGDVVDGSTTIDLGQAYANEPGVASFVVKNLGGSDLTLSDPITLPSGFTLAADFSSHTLAPGESTYFTIRLDSQVEGAYSGNLSFDTNDPDNATFTLPISEHILARADDPANPGFTSVFNDLDPSLEYEVFATWTAASGQATAATYTILDGSYTEGPITTEASDTPNPAEVIGTLGTASIDQTTAPSGSTVDSVVWQSLGSFTATSGVIEVDLSKTGSGTLVAGSVRIVAVHVKEPPVLKTIDDQTLTVGDSLSVTVTATDPDVSSEDLTYSITNQPPPGMAINSSTGEITWNTTGIVAGTYRITVKVADNSTPALTDTKIFSITLTDPDPDDSGSGEPVVSVYTSADAQEGGTPGFIRIFRTGDLTDALTVNYQIDESGDGAAQYGSDNEYVGPTVGSLVSGILTGTATFTTGHATADIPIDSSADTDNADHPTVDFELLGYASGYGSGSGGSSHSYSLGDKTSAEVAITNDLRIQDDTVYVSNSELAAGEAGLYYITPIRAPEGAAITYSLDGAGPTSLFRVTSYGKFELNQDASHATASEYKVSIRATATFLDERQTLTSVATLDVIFEPTLGVYGDTIAIRNSNDNINLVFRRSSGTAELTVHFTVVWGSASADDFIQTDSLGNPDPGFAELQAGAIVIDAGQAEAHLNLRAASVVPGPTESIMSVHSLRIRVSPSADIGDGHGHGITTYDPIGYTGRLLDDNSSSQQYYANLNIIDGVTAFASYNDSPKLVDLNANPTQPTYELGNPGINPNDVFRNQLGDCYFAVTLDALAILDFHQIQSLITENTDGSFDVRLYDDPRKDWLHDGVTDCWRTFHYSAEILSNGLAQLSLSGDYDRVTGKVEIWPQLLELAWKDMAGQGKFSNIDGGYPSDAWTALTGHAVWVTPLSGKTNWQIANAIDLLSIIPIPHMITIGTTSGHQHIPLPNGQFGDQNHVYVITSIKRDDSGNIESLNLMNPWGPTEGITVPFDKFSALFLELNFEWNP